jgi:hypothetical protein
VFAEHVYRCQCEPYRAGAKEGGNYCKDPIDSRSEGEESIREAAADEEDKRVARSLNEESDNCSWVTPFLCQPTPLGPKSEADDEHSPREENNS